MTLLILIFTIVLVLLVNIYKNEKPVGAPPIFWPTQIDSQDVRSRRSSSIIYVNNREVKKMPIITAKVTSQISIDKKNNQENVLFQVIVKENSNFLKSTKKTY